MMINDTLVLGVSALAAYTDVRNHRIPNALPISLFICAVTTIALHDWHELGTFAAILVALIVGGTVLHSLRLIGGGDVKLIAVAAATYGVHDAPVFLVATILCGGIFAIVVAAIRGRLAETFASLFAMAVPAFAGVRPTLTSHGTKMPYAPAIFAGALVVVLMHLMH